MTGGPHRISPDEVSLKFMRVAHLARLTFRVLQLMHPFLDFLWDLFG